MGFGSIMRKKAVKNVSIAMSSTAERLICQNPNLTKEQLFSMVLSNFDLHKAEAEMILPREPSGLLLHIWSFLRYKQIIPRDGRDHFTVIEELEENIPRSKETKFRDEIKEVIETSVRKHSPSLVHKGWL